MNFCSSKVVDNFLDRTIYCFRMNFLNVAIPLTFNKLALFSLLELIFNGNYL